MASEDLNASRAWARATETPTKEVLSEGDGRADLGMAKSN